MYDYKEFSLNSIYKEGLKKIEYINQQKKNNDPKFDAKINMTIHKKFAISREMALLNSGLVNKNNINKYLINTKILSWNSLMKLKKFKIKTINNLLINGKGKQLLIFLQKIRSLNKINSKSLPHLIKIKILTYLIKINDIYFIGVISSNYCNCLISPSDIKKEQYNSGVIYTVHKKFLTKENDFHIKNDFTMNIFETGSIIEFSWNRLGKRIKDN